MFDLPGALKVFVCCLLLPGLLARAAESGPQEDARAMLESEAKFVALGQEQGARTASLAFMADDAIMFEPGPMNAKQVWQARSEATLALKWQPASGAMAYSGDLGFTTGPAEWRRNKDDAKPIGYGQYVSIWKKLSDGTWKVALDVGGSVPSPQKIEGPPEISITVPHEAQKSDSAAAQRKLRAAEGWFADTAKIDSTSALLGASGPAIQVHRAGASPGIGRAPVELMLSVRRGKLSTERLGGDMSQAGDLAYSYGKYSLALDQSTERGHYLQIWQTDAAREWKLLLDYQSALKPAPKKPGE